eukprot:2657458-Pleurochrysis_carterae.AAC.1
MYYSSSNSTVSIYCPSWASGARATIISEISRISESVALYPEVARQLEAFWAGLSACGYDGPDLGVEKAIDGGATGGMVAWVGISRFRAATDGLRHCPS